MSWRDVGGSNRVVGSHQHLVVMHRCPRSGGSGEEMRQGRSLVASTTISPTSVIACGSGDLTAEWRSWLRAVDFRTTSSLASQRIAEGFWTTPNLWIKDRQSTGVHCRPPLPSSLNLGRVMCPFLRIKSPETKISRIATKEDDRQGGGLNRNLRNTA